MPVAADENSGDANRDAWHDTDAAIATSEVGDHSCRLSLTRCDESHRLLVSVAGIIETTQDISGKVATMSATLAVEQLEQQTLDAESELQPAPFIREFCTVCYTDNVSVRADGAIFCAECGHTATRA